MSTLLDRAAVGNTAWHDVCELDRLQPERGVAALVGGVQVAIFRSFGGQLYAVSNIDPFTGAAVLSRGIMGDRGSSPTVASPLHKQVFDLETGQCLDDPGVSLTCHRVRVENGRVLVAVR